MRRVTRSALAVVCATALGLAACSEHAGKALAAIKAKGVLTVLTRNAPTTYYIGRDGQPTGPEYEMASAFAASIGVPAKFVVENSVETLLHDLAAGKGDLVAAGITRTAARARRFVFAPSYQRVTQQVVCRRGGRVPKDAAALSGVSLRVIPDSSYVERLKVLKETRPHLRWQLAGAAADTESLLRAVWRGHVDCTVADSDIVAVNRRYFPNLAVAFDLSRPQPLAWVMRSGQGGLAAAVARWLKKYRRHGRLANVMQHYYGYVKVFDYVDIRAYVRKIENVFPKYWPIFRRAADRHDVPPLVLAAQAYQESHWDPHAVSPTGVRGMMMLTRPTAQMLGIDDRLDPRASIAGGAAYLARMEARLPNGIRAQDRIWYALAAYNLGMAHIKDALTLAHRRGIDADRWSAFAEVLPLLSEKRFYTQLPHGYARGFEPVRYVRRIRSYTDILRVRRQMHGNS